MPVHMCKACAEPAGWLAGAAEELPEDPSGDTRRAAQQWRCGRAADSWAVFGRCPADSHGSMCRGVQMESCHMCVPQAPALGSRLHVNLWGIGIFSGMGVFTSCILWGSGGGERGAPHLPKLLVSPGAWKFTPHLASGGGGWCPHLREWVAVKAD